MSRATDLSSTRRLFNADDPVRVDTVLAAICRELDAVGAHVSPSKVKRLIDQWNDRVRFTGYGLSDWLENQLALHAQERQERACWGLRDVIGNVDTTGQGAAESADRSLGLGERWHE